MEQVILRHELSIPSGAGILRGVSPAENVSMMRMFSPQHGHGLEQASPGAAFGSSMSSLRRSSDVLPTGSWSASSARILIKF